MSDIIDELFGDELYLIEKLKDYSIDYGVLEENGLRKVRIDVIDLDDSKSEIEMSVGDIMYFTEYGSLKFPARNILDKTMHYVDMMITEELDSIIEDILENGLTESDIDNRFQALCFRIEQHVKTMFRNEMQNINNLGNILGKEDENQYLMNLNSLSDYITCKFFKK